MRRAGGLVTIVVVAGAIPACSSREFSSSPPTTDGGGDAAADAGPLPAACPGNLLRNPGFEESTQDWYADQGQLSRVDGHTGARAARVCASGNSTYAALFLSPASYVPASPGDVFHLDAWVRADDGAAAQSLDVDVQDEAPDAADLPGKTSAETVWDPSSGWTHLTTADHVVKSGAASVLVFVGASRVVAGACFDVDDVCLLRR